MNKSLKEKLDIIMQTISKEIGDDCFLSLTVFENVEGDLWHHHHVHNFEREVVIQSLRNIADELENADDEENSISLN